MLALDMRSSTAVCVAALRIETSSPPCASQKSRASVQLRNVASMKRPWKGVSGGDGGGEGGGGSGSGKGGDDGGGDDGRGGDGRGGDGGGGHGGGGEGGGGEGGGEGGSGGAAGGSSLRQAGPLPWRVTAAKLVTSWYT